jgi:DNA-binding NtrC family response regulator
MQAKKILIVDDEVEIGEILYEIISASYSEVQYCSCPEVAIKKIQEDVFDLILTDVNMPKIPGLQLIKFLRDTKTATPIVLLTGFSDKALVEAANELGVFDIVEKPFTTKGIITVIENVLSNTKTEELRSSNYPANSFQRY